MLLVSPDPRQAREAVVTAAGVNSAMLVGDGVHLLVDDAQRRIPEIKQLLTSKGIAFTSLEQIAPSVEDVFVSAVETNRGGTQ